MFLTFDDGPHPVWTPRILSELHSVGAKATFFVAAPLASRFPETVERMIQERHGVALHCAKHIRHTEMTRKEVEEDVEDGLRSLSEVGVTPRLWRPPWGVLAPWTLDVAEDFGLEISLWSADTHDWRGDSAGEMLGAAGPSLSAGDVVLMHDGLGPGATRAGCEETVKLVEPLVSRVREVGCEPATLGVTALQGARA